MGLRCVTWLEALKAEDARPQRAPRTSTSGSSNMLCSSYSGTLNAGDAPKPACTHPHILFNYCYSHFVGLYHQSAPSRQKASNPRLGSWSVQKRGTASNSNTWQLPTAAREAAKEASRELPREKTWDTTAATTLASSTMATVSAEEKLAPELSADMGLPASSLTMPGRCSTDSTAKNTPDMGALKPAATPAHTEQQDSVSL